MQSTLLKDFYYWWANNGTEGFRPDDRLGLCASLGTYVWRVLWKEDFTIPEEEEFWNIREKIQQEMKQQFVDAGLNRIYPFNHTYEHYVKESSSGGCLLNPYRVEWVNSKLQEGDADA